MVALVAAVNENGDAANAAFRAGQAIAAEGFRQSHQFISAPTLLAGVGRHCRAKNLDRLRLDRNLADYQDTVTNLSDLAQADLLMAEEVIENLKTL
jgi:hypothetical protein